MSNLLAPTRLLPSFLDDDTFNFPSTMLERNWPSIFNNSFFRNGDTVPAVNIKENGKTFELELAAPGYKKEDLKVNLNDNVLTISSEQKSEKEEKGEKGDYTRREYSYRSFSRSFTLPENADGDNVKASYENGILKLSIPKTKALPEKHGKEVRIA